MGIKGEMKDMDPTLQEAFIFEGGQGEPLCPELLEELCDLLGRNEPRTLGRTTPSTNGGPTDLDSLHLYRA